MPKVKLFGMSQHYFLVVAKAKAELARDLKQKNEDLQTKLTELQRQVEKRR